MASFYGQPRCRCSKHAVHPWCARHNSFTGLALKTFRSAPRLKRASEKATA